jgi:hypothetical protein
MHGNPPRNQLLKDARGHMLMIEGNDVAALRKCQHRSRIIVAADVQVAHDLRSRIIGRCGKHAKTNTQCGGGLGRHARELAATDHPDNWGAICLRHWHNLLVASRPIRW